MTHRVFDRPDTFLGWCKWILGWVVFVTIVPVALPGALLLTGLSDMVRGGDLHVIGCRALLVILSPYWLPSFCICFALGYMQTKRWIIMPILLGEPETKKPQRSPGPQQQKAWSSWQWKEGK